MFLSNMRTTTPQTGQENELQIVQESSTTLTLQTRVSKAQAMRSAWATRLTLGIGFTFFLGIIALMAMSWSGQGVTQNSVVWAVYIGLVPFGLVWAGLLFTACYQTFTFDRAQQQLIWKKTNLAGKSRVRRILFSDIQAVDLTEQDSEMDDSASPSLILTNKRKLQLSHSPSIRDQIDWTTTLKNHRELAEKIRLCLGLPPDLTPGKRSEEVRIPTEAELQKSTAASKERLKQLTGMVFSGRKGRQERIKALREQVAHNPNNARAWDRLGIALSFQRDDISEAQNAYRRAEMLYRKQGELNRADELAALLKKLTNTQKNSGS